MPESRRRAGHPRQSSQHCGQGPSETTEHAVGECSRKFWRSQHGVGLCWTKGLHGGCTGEWDQEEQAVRTSGRWGP